VTNDFTENLRVNVNCHVLGWECTKGDQFNLQTNVFALFLFAANI